MALIIYQIYHYAIIHKIYELQKVQLVIKILENTFLNYIFINK